MKLRIAVPLAVAGVFMATTAAPDGGAGDPNGSGSGH
jgi:hypothetical protein